MTQLARNLGKLGQSGDFCFFYWNVYAFFPPFFPSYYVLALRLIQENFKYSPI